MDSERIFVTVKFRNIGRFLKWLESEGFERQGAAFGANDDDAPEYLYCGFTFIYAWEPAQDMECEIPKSLLGKFEARNF